MFHAAIITTDNKLIESEWLTTFDAATTWAMQRLSIAIKDSMYVYSVDTDGTVATFVYNFMTMEWDYLSANSPNTCAVSITFSNDSPPSQSIPVPQSKRLYVEYDHTIYCFICQWRENDNDRGEYISYSSFDACVSMALWQRIPITYYGPVRALFGYPYTYEEKTIMPGSYVQTTLPYDGKPYWDYNTQEDLGIIGDKQPYSDIVPAFHYHDCRCVECYKLHYPCEQRDTCEYCNVVFSLMYDINSRNNSETDYVPTGKQVKAECGHIIDYITYQDLGDVDVYPHELLWGECRYCDILTAEYTLRNNNGYCSGHCERQDDTVYCRTCGDNEVRNHGDRCRDCIIYCSYGDCETEVEHEGDMCSYCEDYADSDEENDGSGYLMGDIVAIEDYEGLMNCWIDTRGQVRYVPYCNHDRTSFKLGYRGSCDAERNGCIHFSEYWNSYNRWRYIPENPTSAQIDTMMALCLANTDNLEMPEILKKYQERLVDEPREMLPLTYSVFESTLPRRMREMFRPLMGD